MQNKFLFFSSEVENTTICNSISAQNGAIRCTCGAGLRLRRKFHRLAQDINTKMVHKTLSSINI